jgi:hypothetical protein
MQEVRQSKEAKRKYDFLKTEVKVFTDRYKNGANEPELLCLADWFHIL